MKIPQQEKLRKKMRLAAVFSPSAPVNKSDLFAGRHTQLKDVIGAASQRGQHVIIYGERGVGKTSLVSILSEFMDQVGLKGTGAGSVNCDPTDDFSSLWRKVLREVQVGTEERRIGLLAVPEQATTDLRAFLDTSGVTAIAPDDVRYLLQKLGPTTLIIDEVDRIRDPAATGLMADTIKTLSDHSVPTTLILVGVADSVDGLIAEHASVERAMLQVHMPRMAPGELHEILTKCLSAEGMSATEEAMRYIAGLSRGLPHYTHLLGLYAADHAVEKGRDIVDATDVKYAIQPAVKKAQQSIRNSYHKATSSPRKESLYAQVLLACALSPTDDLGYFATSDIRAPLAEITGKKYQIPTFSPHLNSFCSPERGQVLQRTGTARRFRFRFANPLLQPYVIIHGLDKGLISSDAIESVLATF